MRIRQLGLPLLLTLAIGCNRQAPNAYVNPPPPEVTVVTPVQKEVTEYLEFSGMTQPMETVEIRARVKGFLKEKLFVEGAEVKQGELLLVIDEEPFQIQLKAAETRLKEAEASLQQATVSKAREVARASVSVSESQVQLARQEEKRIRSLFERKIATEAEMEQVTSTRKSREAELESSKANLDQVMATYETSILLNQTQVEAAEIAVRNANLDLSYCRMSAPIDGRISRLNFDIGNLVGDGEASVLATIVKMDPIFAYATISETDVLRTPALTKFAAKTDGQKAEKLPMQLGLAGQDGFPTSGYLDYSDPTLDPGTGTLRTRGVFENKDRALLPGMFVHMRIPVATRADALLVPERALGTDQSGAYLLIVASDGTVEYRAVKTGVSIDDMRVVDGKLAPSDQVIVEGLLRARPGSKVVPVPQKSESDVAVSPGSGRR